MSGSLLNLYHRLPAPARSLAATLRGYHLRRWRYGADTASLVKEVLERDYWTRQQWDRWRSERLAFVLDRAARRVPYYREQWARRRRLGDRCSWSELQNWPILEKESVRENPRAFLADDCDARKMFCEHTSGTTGKALELWSSRSTVKCRYALYEARRRVWNGVSLTDRWAMLAGQLVVPVTRRKPPFWVWNHGLRQLYMSSYHLAADLLPHYLDALKKYGVTYVLGYPSSIFAVAQQALRERRRDLKMKVVLAIAEPLLDHQRETISEAFQCPVRESYGMAELVAGASECPSGSLHLWPCMGHVEVIENEQPVAAEAAGDLICTSLLNADMPLIRYRVGDRGALADSSTVCSCGRSLPILRSVDGRIDDVLYTRDRRRIGRLDPVFKSNLPLRESQIIQESLDRLRVRYVPAAGFTQQHARTIVQRIRDRVGSVQVIMEPVAEVPRTSGGKFRAVVCHLPADERHQLDAGT